MNDFYTINDMSGEQNCVSLDDLRFNFFSNFDNIRKKKSPPVLNVTTAATSAQKRKYAQIDLESPPYDSNTETRNVFTTILCSETLHILRYPWFFKLKFMKPSTKNDVEKPTIVLTWSKINSGMQESDTYTLDGTAENLEFPFDKNHFISQVTNAIYVMCKYI